MVDYNKYYWNYREERKAKALAYYYAHREAILEKWKRQRAERTPDQWEEWRVKRRSYEKAHRLRLKAKRIAGEAQEPGASYLLKREL